MIYKHWIKLYELLSDLGTTTEDYKAIDYSFGKYYLTAYKYKSRKNDSFYKISINISCNRRYVLRLVYTTGEKYVGINELLDFIDNLCSE